MVERYKKSAAPVKQGEELTVTIESKGERGDGIARVKGFVIFVSNARPGERVKIRLKKVLDNVGFAEVVSKHKDKKQENFRRDPKTEVEFEREVADVEKRVLKYTEKEDVAPAPTANGEQVEDTEDFGEEDDLEDFFA